MSDMLRTALCDRRVSFVHFECTDSTNMRAREYVKQDGANIPALFLADTQTCGRGRLGRSFYSPDAAGLYMTFLMKTSDSSELFSRITSIAAVCASDAVFECFGVRAKIKWVNDLYVFGRKVAGILAESFVERDERYVALGIGINIFASDLPEEIKDKAAPLFSARGGNDWKERRDILVLSLTEKLLDATKKNSFPPYEKVIRLPITHECSLYFSI